MGGADGVGCFFEGDLIDIVACRPLEDEATLRIPLSQLHQATQMLINNLGCRDAEVLDRISTAFRLVSSGHGAIGLTIVEFRGYVASVLTQIHRELEWRQQIQPDAEF